MTTTLTPLSQGIVHSTPGRSRLRVPSDYRDGTLLRDIEKNIQLLSGIKYAESNERTGSIIVYHESDPHVLQRIGQAIKVVNVQLFAVMAAPRPEPSAAPNLIALLSGVVSGSASDNAEDAGPEPPQALALVKHWVPVAFFAAGVVRLIQTETLLTGVSPLILFYYAFDSFWKFTHDQEVGSTGNELPDRHSKLRGDEPSTGGSAP